MKNLLMNNNYNNKKEIDSANDAEDELSHNSIIDLKKNKEIKLNESNRKSNQFNLIKTINFNDKKDEDSIISDTKTTKIIIKKKKIIIIIKKKLKILE